jgi:hypothetical protein
MKFTNAPNYANRKNTVAIRNGKRNNNVVKYDNSRYVIYREHGRFAPDRMKVNLVWLDTTATRTVTSSDAMNWSIRSSAFDPDPAGFTGSIPGFVELANIYSLYRVHKIKLDLEVCNQNTEAVLITAWPSNIAQNTNSLTKADILEYAGNVRASSAIVGTTSGMSKAKLSVVASGDQLIGPNYRTDLDYAASTSGNPTEMFHINVGAANYLGNFTYPIVTRAKYVYTVEFFRLRQLNA